MSHRHVHRIEHPLVQHLLDEARDRRTPTPRFRQIVRILGSLLAYEATRDLAMVGHAIETPLEGMRATRLSGPITAVPVLRAGLGLAEGMQDLIPDLRVGHLGMFRDEDRLEPVSYYRKLPADIAAGPVLVVDPMLATGGSAVAALTLLLERGCRDLRFVCMVAAPEGIERLAGVCGEVPIYTAAVDRQLNERGYILPGLGDAGDRLYGTLA
ncbi:MAG: uracil phosphoribosyltransferase [Phycisphaeraceae bacterium]|nr:uracil phosphoribosyltransferase [Phycisphaeraceae bacterium]